jgi:hypothetical protein
MEINIKDVLKTYKLKGVGIKNLTKYKHWFPIEPCPRVAGIVADLMADGHLQKGRMWRMDYCSASLEELERLNNEIKELFGYSGYTRSCVTNKFGETYLLAINCSQLGRVMSLLGVPRGQKVLTKFNLPKWITNDKECFRKFIQRLFDCEGCVDEKTFGIEVRMNKELSILENGIQFFTTIKDHLNKHFGIITTNPFLGGKSFRKDGKITQAIRLKIRRKAEILKFANEFKFDSKIKQERLELLAYRIKLKSGNGGI